MVEPQSSKLMVRVRFSSPAPKHGYLGVKLPSTKEIILFMLNNDARFRTRERNKLTKKITKSLKVEAPSAYWGYYGSMIVIVAIMLVTAGLMVIDAETKNLDAYIYTILGTMIAGIPVIGFGGFKMFETYFKLHPEDFPND